eukprot:6177950-Pleurochrysis_carterae.AAC.1
MVLNSKVEARFGDHLDMLFHKQNKFISLDAGDGLHVRPLNSADFEYICKEHHSGVIPVVITRGNAAGGPSAKLSAVAVTAWLWGARLPGVSG